MKTPPPTRLASLLNARARIDQEIEREERYLERIQRLSGDMKAVINNRMDLTERILTLTAYHFSVTVPDLRSPKRGRTISDARHVCAWLLRMSGRSFPEIGAALCKDHTSAMHGTKRVDRDDELAAHAAIIRGALLGEDVA